jgi:hypothetical protein
MDKHESRIRNHEQKVAQIQDALQDTPCIITVRVLDQLSLNNGLRTTLNAQKTGRTSVQIIQELQDR